MSFLTGVGQKGNKFMAHVETNSVNANDYEIVLHFWRDIADYDT